MINSNTDKHEGLGTTPEFNYELELAKAREAAAKLQGELERNILGKTLGAWKCCCGAFSHGESQAVKILQGGRKKEYEYQITVPLSWTVEMQDIAQEERGYSIGLSQFLEDTKVEEMFARHFAGVDAKGITHEYFARLRKAQESRLKL